MLKFLLIPIFSFLSYLFLNDVSKNFLFFIRKKFFETFFFVILYLYFIFSTNNFLFLNEKLKLLFLFFFSIHLISDLYEKSLYSIVSYFFGISGFLFLFSEKIENINNKLITFFILFLIFYFFHFLTKKIYNEEVFGMGDVIFIPFLAFYFDYLIIIYGIFFASFIASFFGILIYTFEFLFRKKREHKIMLPFIPFLFLGINLSILFFKNYL